MKTQRGIQIPPAPLPTEEEKDQMTRDALKSLDEGQGISDPDMQVWFDHLEAKLAAKRQ